MASRPDVFARAVREFGTTFNYDVAGYILPDGQMLDFGGGSAYDRGLDHRAIASVIRVGDGRWDSVFAFMSKGAIRLSTSSQGTWIFLDFAKGVLPTRQQLAVIGEIFRRAQECVVNVTDKNGQVLRETELLGHLTVAAVNQFLEEALEQLAPKRSKRQPAGAWKGKAELVRRMAYGWDSPLAVGNLCKLIANDLDVDVTAVSRRSGDIEELLTQAYNAGYTDRQGRKLVRVPGAWVFRPPGALAGVQPRALAFDTVLFHGSRTADIREFKASSTGEFGPGVYFAPDEGTARFYARSVAAGPDAPRIYRVRVQLSNPLRVLKTEWIKMTQRSTPRTVQRRLIAKGHDGIIGVGINGHSIQVVVFNPGQPVVLGYELV